MQSGYEERRSNRRLDPWKEIAAFFSRDERTVKRWEKERALPVHRLPGNSGARVFAFTDELSRWMHAPNSSGDAAVADQEAATLTPQVPSAADAAISTAPQQPSAGTALPPTHVPSGKLWFVLLAAILAMTGLVVLAYRRESQARADSPPGSMATHATASTAPGLKIPAARAVDPEAQQLYLRGRYYWDKRTPADLTKAVDFFTQAIVRDPNYAQAYVGLADCYNLLREYTSMPAQQAYPRALAAARKAVELDDSSAEAHNSLAFVTFYWNWDAAGAEREFRRAIELNPNYVTAHHWYATFLMVLGRFPEALREIDRAQQLDPASTPIVADKAWILFNQADKEQAILLLKQLESSQPAFFSTHQYLAYIYLADRDYPDYLEQWKKSATLSHDGPELAVVHAAERGFRIGGERTMLESTLRTQRKLFAEGAMPAFSVASSYALLGNQTEALRYLQTSYQRHEPVFLSLRTCQAMLPLHDDPSFRELVVQAGLPPLP